MISKLHWKEYRQLRCWTYQDNPEDRSKMNVISLDDEDEEFTNKFRQAINNEEMKDADDCSGK